MRHRRRQKVLAGGYEAELAREDTQKFDRVKRSGVEDLLRDAQRATGRFGEVQIAEVGESVFCIYR